MLANYSYYRDDTIDHTLIDADLTDLPILVKLTSTNFDFSHVRSDMNDVRFTDTSDNLFKQEGERRDQANSQAEFWVKVPSVSSAADTTVRMQYGNADETSNGDDAANVWDSNFKMVQHMPDDPDTSHIADSTGNNNDGTKGSAGAPAEIDAQIAKGQDYDRANQDYIEVAANTSLDLNYVTIEIWAKSAITDYTTKDASLLNKKNTNPGTYGIAVYNTDDKVMAICRLDGNEGTLLRAYADSAIDTNWHHYVNTYDGDKLHLYVDGAVQTDYDDTDGVIDPDNSGILRIGNHPTDLNNGFDGIIDEVRISNIARSAAWIKASYNSGNDTLLTYGSEETGGVTTIKDLIGGTGIIVFPR